ncbi:efflux RND transporter periplasmic adaptor subunit [Palleronia caenipelagi]|uniref:Efflux RND transporter periplasmic adaptor subunit n=1 Tax=Palleronia caenipelagi TaxID=2489174 RepID=A0A547Q5G9_9RHOB|nr:efflux RND transporter periplasmic adaptor subunit [Palleronia caenipelagi]TRD21631.1 efflux RND transporter periplasmic adaptor subunit [Palleronia caenipelagi]
MYHRFATVVLSSVLIASPLFAQDGADSGEEQAPAVIFETAEKIAVGDSYRFLGNIEAIERVAVRARVDGFIEEVAFGGGEFVDEGDVLFKIEQDRYAADVAAAQARVSSATAQLTDAERTLARNTELRKSNTVSQASLDDATAAFEAAKGAELEAKAALTQAQLNLDYTTIQAPISGKMSAPIITRGNYVAPASGQLAELVQLDPIWGTFSLGESRWSTWQRLGIETSDPAPLADGDGDQPSVEAATTESNKEYVLNLVLPDGSVYDAPGAFEFVGNEINAQTGAVDVRVRFDNPNGVLLPNQNVTLLVTEANPPVVPVISQSAIQLSREGRAVWVLNDDDTATLKPVRVGAGPQSGKVAVLQGLEGGERVVVQGGIRLEEGMKTDPRQAESDSSAAPGGSDGESSNGGSDTAEGADK